MDIERTIKNYKLRRELILFKYPELSVAGEDIQDEISAIDNVLKILEASFDEKVEKEEIDGVMINKPLAEEYKNVLKILGELKISNKDVINEEDIKIYHDIKHINIRKEIERKMNLKDLENIYNIYKRNIEYYELNEFLEK